MTELAIRPEETTEHLPVAAYQPQIHSELLLWVEEAKQANQIAKSLANTSFVPASLRGKPHDITAAILAGKELGLQPMATLRSMDVIQGTPALRAHAMRGLVQSHGHKVELVEQSPTKVIVHGQRREADGSYGSVQVSTWTIERAQQLGLTVKDQWKKQPQTMLTARATGEICRLIASDVLHAMPYAVEELDESSRYESTVVAAPVRVTAAEITAGQAPVSTPPASAAPPAATEPAPVAEPEQPAAAEPDQAAADDTVEGVVEPDKASQEQHRDMRALWDDLGYGGDTNRLARLEITGKILGLPEPLESSATLTVDQADTVINALKQRKAAQS